MYLRGALSAGLCCLIAAIRSGGSPVTFSYGTCAAQIAFGSRSFGRFVALSPRASGVLIQVSTWSGVIATMLRPIYSRARKSVLSPSKRGQLNIALCAAARTGLRSIDMLCLA